MESIIPKYTPEYDRSLIYEGIICNDINVSTYDQIVGVCEPPK